MTTPGQGKPETPAAGKPAASLLTVPLFKDQGARRRRQHAEPRSDGGVANRHDESVASIADAAEVPPALREESPPPPDDIVDTSRFLTQGDEPAGSPEPAEDAAAPESRRAPRVEAHKSAEADSPAAPRTPADIRELKRYWRRVGHGRHPEIEDLDAGTIAANWPNTLLIRVARDGLVDILRVYAPEPGSGEGEAAGHPFAGDRFSQLSTWVLDLARQAARDAAPLETTENFALGAGQKALTARVLPCGSRTDPADFVLLNIAEAETRHLDRTG
ncbi:hypothetical protein [Ferruginivarius sediminum]|uniref:Uncharacterized protein n=1 Tax=Ferruginivarius sediminum TaxID=2661937 RepID=A0A369T954_9PROT|nr:hypothetical protein [Ferruginivarius sediminum]RDD60905.1 hypothetical protein DRB17_15710 [Ferruginivarius sediminum]